MRCAQGKKLRFTSSRLCRT